MSVLVSVVAQADQWPALALVLIAAQAKVVGVGIGNVRRQHHTGALTRSGHVAHVISGAAAGVAIRGGHRASWSPDSAWRFSAILVMESLAPCWPGDHISPRRGKPRPGPGASRINLSARKYWPQSFEHPTEFCP
jgi:hypothetical protein